MMQAQAPLIQALQQLFNEQAQTLLEDEQRFRHLVYDALGAEAEIIQIRLLADLVSAGFVRKLYQQPEHFITLAELAALDLRTHYPEADLDQGLLLWKRALPQEILAGPSRALVVASGFRVASEADPDPEKAWHQKLSRPQQILLAAGGALLLLGGSWWGLSALQASPEPDPTAAMATDTAPANAPEATALPTPEATQAPTTEVQQVVEKWQVIKQAAFTHYDTSRIAEVMQGKALRDTTGGVDWWTRTAGAAFHGIQLHELQFLNTTFPAENLAKVLVQISETRDTSQNGRRQSKTSSYQAEYTLEYYTDGWYITEVRALE